MDEFAFFPVPLAVLFVIAALGVGSVGGRAARANEAWGVVALGGLVLSGVATYLRSLTLAVVATLGLATAAAVMWRWRWVHRDRGRRGRHRDGNSPLS